MRAADETPASGPNQWAEKAYNTDGNCQGPPPPGSPEEPPVKGKPGRKASTDLGQLYHLYLSQPSQDRLDELMKCCLKFLEKRVSYWVVCKGFCPAWLHPNTFAPDAFDRACDKFSLGIHALRSPQLLERWLKKVAFSAVVEELRKIRGREKEGPRHWGPFDIEHPDGTVTHVLDRAENSDAAIRYGCVTVKQTEIVKQLVYRDVLGKLFRAAETGSKRQREGIELLEMMLKDDLTTEEVVAQCGMKKSQVLSLLRSARKQLQRIAETRYKFTAEDL